MKAYIASCPFGVFAFDEERGELLKNVLFEKDPRMAALRLREIQRRSISAPEKKLIEELKNGGYREFVFEVEKEGQRYEIPNPCGEFLRANMEKIAKEYGFVKNRQQFVKFVSEVCFQLTELRLKEMKVDDRLAIHLAEAIEEVKKSINLLVLRLREWYGIYYPELVATKENEEIVEYVVEKLYRDKESIGHEVSKEELEIIRAFAIGINELYKLEEELERKLEHRMKKLMPNTTHLVGSSLAAALLIHAGSLERLARFPSSTIQVLGAEKALFRYLSGKGKAPKHGVIFLSRYVQEAPKKFKGKMARKLASKISIAAKVDYFDRGEKFVADKLKKELDEELKNTRLKVGSNEK